MPPPLPPVSLFHAFWVAVLPEPVIVVPPTPVTYGWLAGSSTALAVEPVET
jgi:hypothetical protein